MATQTKTRPAADPKLDQLADRARALNDQIIEASRKAGRGYLDVYERSLESIAASQEKLAKSTEETPAEWVATLLNAQAEFTRDTGKVVTSYYRELIK